MFEQLQTLLAAKAKIENALKNDEILLERIPRTMVKRKEELQTIDAQLSELKSKLEQTVGSQQKHK